MAKILALLPPSEQLPEQLATLGAIFAGHELLLGTSPQDAAQHIGECEIIVSTAFIPLSADLLAKAGRLKFVQVAGVGTDHVDLAAAYKQGAQVAAVAKANTTSVAEHTVMSILALLRGLAPAHTAMAQDGWPLPFWMGHAQDLAEKTVGIVGLGTIGQAVAERLLPFGVSLLYSDVKPASRDTEDRLGVTHMELGPLLSVSDIVTLHLPLVASTRHLLDRDRLFAMKPGAYLVNTARAELLDEAALVEALQTHLGGAAIDVFSQEPPPVEHPLRKLPNVLLTPHGAGVTRQAQERISKAVVMNLLRYLDGRPIADVIQPPEAGVLQ